ncbi:MAG: hypothetical protein ACYTFT_13420 [Planctomycetota bacterium]
MLLLSSTIFVRSNELKITYVDDNCATVASARFEVFLRWARASAPALGPVIERLLEDAGLTERDRIRRGDLPEKRWIRCVGPVLYVPFLTRRAFNIFNAIARATDAQRIERIALEETEGLRRWVRVFGAVVVALAMGGAARLLMM